MLIKGANAYVGGKFRRCDILIRGERIAKIAKKIAVKDKETINASGLVAFPGLIELHAHLREPGQTEKEDFLSGSMAALAGGYTLVYDMPNNMPRPTITKEALEEKRRLAKKALCEIRFHFGATEHNFADVEGADPQSLKLYMGHTTGNLTIGAGTAYEHMLKFPKEKQIIVHAQDGETPQSAQDGVQCAIGLAQKAERKIHVTHASTAKEVEIARGWKLCTVDTAPHYLFLSKEDAAKMKPRELGLVHPPLRSRAEVSSLWKKLAQIDAICTDHAPHLVADKAKGARGFPGLETALSLFLDAYSKKKVTLEWIATRFSENPARIMGIYGDGYGKIEEGAYANIALVDLKKTWTVKGSEMYSRCGWTPFEGRKLKGEVVKTICRGKSAYHINY